MVFTYMALPHPYHSHLYLIIYKLGSIKYTAVLNGNSKARVSVVSKENALKSKGKHTYEASFYSWAYDQNWEDTNISQFQVLLQMSLPSMS